MKFILYSRESYQTHAQAIRWQIGNGILLGAMINCGLVGTALAARLAVIAYAARAELLSGAVETLASFF